MDHGDCSESCPPCFEAFDFEAEIKQYIAQKCRDRMPDELRARIADAIGHAGPEGAPA